MIASRHNLRVRSARAFTLVEVLLVIGLLALLAGIAWPLFRTDTPYQKIQRTANRLSSLLAMCRAEAMLQGHPYRVTWPTATQPAEDSTAPIQPEIMHETDPVGAPGQYNPVAASWANEPVFDPGVQIRLIQPGTFDIASLAATKGRFTVPTDPSLVDVAFHPDGTADPAVFVLTTSIAATGDPLKDELQYWVILDGITGLPKISEPPTPTDYDNMLAQQTSLPDLQFQEQPVEVTMPDQQGGDQTLASMLNGGTGGGTALSNSDLQSIISQLRPLLSGAGAAAGTGGRGAASGTSAGAGSGRNAGGSPNSGNNGNNRGNSGGRGSGGRAR